MPVKGKTLIWVSISTISLGICFAIAGLMTFYFESELTQQVSGLSRIFIFSIQFAVIGWGVWLLTKVKNATQVQTSFRSWGFAGKIRFSAYLLVGVITIASIATLIAKTDHLPHYIVLMCRASLLFALNSSFLLNIEHLLGKLKTLDLILTNLIIIALGLEIGLEILSHLKPSPLFYKSGLTKQSIEAHRMRPHFKYFDFTCNSQGYLDTEFDQKQENEIRIAAIGDSYAFGKVPYRDNFLTLTEKHLEKCKPDGSNPIVIHNYGIPSSGPTEYAYLLETEVLKSCPDYVLLCIFTGNDIKGFQISRPDKWIFQNWWIYKVPRALVLMCHEKPQTYRLDDKSPTMPIPDYMYNPDLEKPHYSDEQYFKIVNQRAEILNQNSPITLKCFNDFFLALDYFRDTLGDKLIIAILPQEIQVDDALYHHIIQKKQSPQSYQQNLPQQKIIQYCAKNQIPCINLLPEMKRHSPTKRKYFLKETHWNVLGNHIAADSLSKEICSRIYETKAL